ncbi:NACHT, LRR and PYD domains-containing protein 2-like [Ctenodactylus gundi]
MPVSPHLEPPGFQHAYPVLLLSEAVLEIVRVFSWTSSRIAHLDLGLNRIGILGARFLCGALQKPECPLRSLWLWGCSISPLSCREVFLALGTNQTLTTLDLGQSSLGLGEAKTLCDSLKLQSCPLQTLRLKINESDPLIQKVLREIKEINPRLTIINSDQRRSGEERPSWREFFSSP